MGRTTIYLVKNEWFFSMVASPDTCPPSLTVTVDVFAGEDDSVEFDERLRVDARTRVAPVDCEFPAWLTGKPTGDLIP